MARIKKIIAEYNGFHTDYIFTTYYPNGLIDEEEGIEAIQVLTDKGGWTINFTQNGDEYNFTNVLEILQKSDFSAIAGMEPEMEVGDSSGVDGQLFLNGEIHQSDEEHLIIKGASEIIDNDWDKIGERDTYEVVFSGGEGGDHANIYHLKTPRWPVRIPYGRAPPYLPSSTFLQRVV